jgi:hypothetical protein
VFAKHKMLIKVYLLLMLYSSRRALLHNSCNTISLICPRHISQRLVAS